MAPRLSAVLCLAALLYNVANYVRATVQMTEFQITTRSLCPGYTLLEIDAISTGHCAIKCHRNALEPNLKCIGFCYNYSAMKCRLYKKNFEDANQDSKWVNIRHISSSSLHSKGVTLCTNRNEWLVIPQTDEELEKIGVHLGDYHYHVGLSSVHAPGSGNFTTATGKKAHRYFWRPNVDEPGNITNQNCVVGYGVRGWYDRKCDRLDHVYCQTPEPVTCLEAELMDQLPDAAYDTSTEPCYKLK